MGAHDDTDVAPYADDHVQGGHAGHVEPDGSTRPTTSEYVPRGQSLHCTPKKGWNCPAGQFAHAPPGHSEHAVLPAPYE